MHFRLWLLTFVSDAPEANEALRMLRSPLGIILCGGVLPLLLDILFCDEDLHDFLLSSRVELNHRPSAYQTDALNLLSYGSNVTVVAGIKYSI